MKQLGAVTCKFGIDSLTTCVPNQLGREQCTQGPNLVTVEVKVEVQVEVGKRIHRMDACDYKYHNMCVEGEVFQCPYKIHQGTHPLILHVFPSQ